MDRNVLVQCLASECSEMYLLLLIKEVFPNCMRVLKHLKRVLREISDTCTAGVWVSLGSVAGTPQTRYAL